MLYKLFISSRFIGAITFNLLIWIQLVDEKQSGFYMAIYYCKFRNFHKNFIFLNIVKIHICDVKISN